MLMSPMIVGPRMGSMTLTLAVFLNLTLGGLPQCCLFKNLSRTGACEMASKLSLLIHPGWLLQTLDYRLLGSESPGGMLVYFPVLYLRVCLDQGSEDYLCWYPVCQGTLCHLSPPDHHVVTGTHPVHFQCFLLFAGFRLSRLVAHQGTLDHILRPDLTMATGMCHGGLYWGTHKVVGWGKPPNHHLCPPLYPLWWCWCPQGWPLGRLCWPGPY